MRTSDQLVASVQEYMQLLHQLEVWQSQIGKPASQATCLMVLPHQIDTRPLADIPGFNLPGAGILSSPENGIGFSRLCCQLVAYASEIQSVWLLDDNIRQCYRLDYEKALATADQRFALEHIMPITFADAMQTLQASINITGSDLTEVCGESRLIPAHALHAYGHL